MNIFLTQAKQILDSVDIKDPKVSEAKELLGSITKTAALADLIHDAKFQNIVNLLTPFVVNYKVNQVLRLLEELAKESQGNVKYDSATGLRKYI